jgi:hypothetical protein
MVEGDEIAAVVLPVVVADVTQEELRVVLLVK